MPLDALLAEFDVMLLRFNGHVRKPRQTKCGGILRRLYDEHGEGHVRSLLVVLTQTSEGAALAIRQPVLDGLSDLLLAHELDGDTLDKLDGIDLGDLEEQAKRLAHLGKVRTVFATLLAGRLGLVDMREAA